MNNSTALASDLPVAKQEEANYPTAASGISVIIFDDISLEVKRMLELAQVSNEVIVNTKSRLTLENGFMEIPAEGSLLSRFKALYKYANGKYIWVLRGIPNRTMVSSMRAFTRDINGDEKKGSTIKIGYYNCLFYHPQLLVASDGVNNLIKPNSQSLKQNLKADEIGNSLLGILNLLSTTFLGNISAANSVIIPRKLISHHDLASAKSLDSYICSLGKKYRIERLNGICYLPGESLSTIVRTCYDQLRLSSSKISQKLLQ